MKRGLIAWDKAELPQEAFDSRLKSVREYLDARDLPALIVYSDLWRSNQARYFSNFMPYFNRAFLVIPRQDPPLLLCGLSPRVYPWIKSVTILPEILPSPNLPRRLLELCAERAWTTLALLDFDQFPYDLYDPVNSGIKCEGVAAASIRRAPDPWEIAMHARAAGLAREGLQGAMHEAVGLRDRELTGRLELRLRQEGAEDLIVLLSNGDRPPAPARDDILREGFSAIVALEYRGHWAKVGFPHGEAAPHGRTWIENLSGPLPYAVDVAPADGSVVAQLSEGETGGRREFFCETFVKTAQGLEAL